MNTIAQYTAAEMTLVNPTVETKGIPNFSWIYKCYADKVYSKCISMLKEEALAKDACQEIFVKIYLNLSKFREDSKFSSWVFAITNNYCIDFLRKKQRAVQFIAEEKEKNNPEFVEEGTDPSLIKQKRAQLERVLAEMPEGDRTILMMKYQDNLSIKEMAIGMGISESAVKMRLKRAKNKARKLKLKLFSN